MTLKDTMYWMTSDDYKKRFIAEYWQTKIRYERLKQMNTRIEAAERTKYAPSTQAREPKHDCPMEILREQQLVMGEYLHLLELRAVIEDVDLEEK